MRFFFKRKNIEKYAVTVLFTIVILLSFSLVIVSKDCVRKRKSIEMMRFDVEAIAQKFIDQYRINQKSLPEKDVLFGINGQTLSFKALYSGKNRLIFYHPGNLCSQCIKAVFDEFKAFVSKTDFENITIISKFENIREAKLFRDEYEIKGDIFGITSSEMDFKIRGESLPFFCVLDSTLTNCYTLIPHMKYPGMVQYYIEILKERHIISEGR